MTGSPEPSPDTYVPPEETFWERVKTAAKVVAFLVILLWAVEGLDQLLFGERLDAWGIRPRTFGGLWGVFAAPFLHGGFVHLGANTGPLIVLASLLLVLRGLESFLGVSLAVVLGGGLGVWLTGAAHSVHIGASGVVFGWLGYLILFGFVERRLLSLLTSIGVAVAYGSLLWGVLPAGPHISWQGHLFGFVSGLAVAWFGRRRRQKSLPAA